MNNVEYNYLSEIELLDKHLPVLSKLFVLDANAWNHLTMVQQISSGSF